MFIVAIIVVVVVVFVVVVVIVVVVVPFQEKFCKFGSACLERFFD